jgi:hypothetical protein
VTLRQVTPASGASQITITWDGGPGPVLQAGQILDVPAGGALEAAIGLANLTSLAGNELYAAQTGGGPAATDN